jgi:hypothetical protein
LQDTNSEPAGLASEQNKELTAEARPSAQSFTQHLRREHTPNHTAICAREHSASKLRYLAALLTSAGVSPVPAAGTFLDDARFSDIKLESLKQPTAAACLSAYRRRKGCGAGTGLWPQSQSEIKVCCSSKATGFWVRLMHVLTCLLLTTDDYLQDARGIP